MNSIPFDFIVKNENGTLAIIEVKNRKNLNMEDAKKLRRNMMGHSNIDSKYFVIISQEYGFVWDNEPSTPFLENSPLRFSMQEIVSRYYKNIASHESRLRDNELEIIVSQWINDLARANESQQFTTEPEKTLAEGGFIHSIHGATVHSEVQA